MVNFTALIILCLALAGLTACQLAPTKARDSRDVPREWYSRGQLKPVVIVNETVFLDARPAFEYGLSHVDTAVQFGWEKLTEGGSQKSAELPRDLDKAAAKLALIGISPTTPVVIVGGGREGNGEGGRLAWTLKYLGIRNVQVVGSAYFRTKLTQKEPAPRENVPNWSAKPQEKMLTSREEIIQFSGNKQDMQTRRTHLIDVRSQQEYFARNSDGQYLSPEIQAINIEWKEFIDNVGRPDPQIAEKLKAMGLGLNDRILLIDDKGVRSAASAMALYELGYRNVGQLNGGYRKLLKK